MICLVAQLQKLRRLGGAIRIYRSVVADDPAGVTTQCRRRADRGGAITRFERFKIRSIDNARDQFADVIGLAVVCSYQAGTFVGAVDSFGALVRMHDFAREMQRVCIVVGEVFDQPGYARVHRGATEFFFVSDFTGGGM